MKPLLTVLWLIDFISGAAVTTLQAEPLSANETRKVLKLETGQPSKAMVQQKLMLVKMTLSSSQFFEKAAQSDNEAMKNRVAEVLAKYSHANDALNSSDIGMADKLADEVLNMIEEISRTASDPEQEAVASRSKYEGLLKDLAGSESAYHDLSSRLTKPLNKSASEKFESSRKSKEKALVLAKAGQYQKANNFLEDAHAEVVAALSNMLGDTALMYELKFNSDAEEYDYELARYHSYEELAPIAYIELKPDEFTIKLSERYVQESRVLRDKAKSQAENGEHRAAINTLMEAIKGVKTALRVLGLVLQE